LAAASEPRDGLGALVDSFIGTPYAETTAALTALRALITDEVMRARISRELAGRRHPMPAWLRHLTEARIEPDVWLLTDVLGDGDDYLFGATLPSGQAMSALVYVDHNLGTVVKDAFVVPEALEDLVIKVGTTMNDPDQSLTRTDAAAARALVESAIALGSRLYPPLESDSWPMCRPMIEWMLRLLPAGGVVPGRREWSPAETAAIVTDFFASPFGSTIEGPDERKLLENILWFGTDYATGDPYRWSPVTVELLLVDWVPRKIVAEPSYLAKLPEVLRGYIRYCHDRQGIRASLTRDTLAAVEQYEPEYQRTIRSDRLQGPPALLAGLFDADDEEGIEDPNVQMIMLERMDRAVGGRLQLMNLDAAPLPDEEFEWAGVPEDIEPVVRQVLEACDTCADEILDVEHRTAMRRFLSRSAVGDPVTFRRKASPQRAAAAVAWVICRANGTVGSYYQELSVQELLAHFGLKGSVSQRAESMLRANGVDPHRQYGSMDLGVADLLTSGRRAGIIEARDRYLEQLPPSR
jgi:hypothetical protein